MTPEPEFALSVRQPWAWLILNAGKDVENREWASWPHLRRFRGPVWLHASQSMTRKEYDDAMNWIANNTRIPLDFHEPEPHEPLKGGIVGQMVITDCVERSESPWFTGPYGLVLREVKPVPFRQCKGALGFFRPQFT